MIVSSDLGKFALAPPRRKRNFKAVNRSVPGSNVVSAVAPQVPTFNLSKSIAKPFLYNDGFAPKKNVVPLKCLQEGSHEEGVSLFNAPIYLVPEPLKQPIPVARTIDLMAMYHAPEVSFDVPFDYNAGIRPGLRVLTKSPVEEPDYPFPTRTGRSALGKETYGTYRVGKKDYEVLGY